MKWNYSLTKALLCFWNWLSFLNCKSFGQHLFSGCPAQLFASANCRTVIANMPFLPPHKETGFVINIFTLFYKPWRDKANTDLMIAPIFPECIYWESQMTLSSTHVLFPLQKRSQGDFQQNAAGEVNSDVLWMAVRPASCEQSGRKHHKYQCCSYSHRYFG